MSTDDDRLDRLERAVAALADAVALLARSGPPQAEDARRLVSEARSLVRRPGPG